MKAERLPSGNYRVRMDVVDVDGTKHRKSFTGKTKREALQKAEKYKPVSRVSVAEIVARYIELKEKVLSPSTVRAYRTILRNYVEGTALGKKDVARVEPADVQKWVSDMVGTMTSKSIKNALSLVSASFSMYAPDVQIRAKVPQQTRTRLHAPTDDDINALLEVADGEMLKAILLGAFCGLRRGEICALDADDLDRVSGKLSITKAVVRGENGYSIKPPKTDDSNRDVMVPPWIMEILPEEGPLVDMTLAAVTTAFGRIVKKAGLPHFRFHDLRHYFATRLSYIGVPEKIICGINGWKTARVFKAHYEDLVSDEMEKEKVRIMDYFGKKCPRFAHGADLDVKKA